MLGFIQNLGAMEIFLILLIVLLLFGAKRLPELSRSIGKSLREFKKATSDVEDDIRSAMNDDSEKEKEKEKKSSSKIAVPLPRSETAPTSDPVPVATGDLDPESKESEKKD